jgi:hypothetical protein
MVFHLGTPWKLLPILESLEEKESLLRIIGPNFRVVLRLRGGVVAEAARPVSYMKGWRVERVLALAERWGWKAEMSDGERAQATQATQASPAP